MHDMYWMGVLCGHFLAMYWADVSHETTPCLVCWISANIAEWSTLQLNLFETLLHACILLLIALGQTHTHMHTRPEKTSHVYM